MKIRKNLSILSLMTVLAVSSAPANANIAPPEEKCGPSCTEALKIFFLELKPKCSKYECKAEFKAFANGALRWKNTCVDCDFETLYDTYRKTNNRPFPYDTE